jgi:hypothetical protein
VTGLIPTQRGPWTEAAGRRVVWARSNGTLDEDEPPQCEACGTTQGVQWSHRIARSRGGSWAPSNGVALCLVEHGWAHSFPTAAGRLGWHVRTGFDPRTVPVWLARPWPGFWLLPDASSLLRPAHPEDHPDLPDRAELVRLLPPAARGALR